jgi:hypothetical protein
MRGRSNVCKAEKMQKLYGLVDGRGPLMGTYETFHDAIHDKNTVGITFTFYWLSNSPLLYLAETCAGLSAVSSRP